MDKIRLKRCPFCGGEALSQISWESGGTLSLIVKCSQCHISKETVVKLSGTDFNKLNMAMQNAADDWNKRADCALKKLWCVNQTTDSDSGQIICMAHLAESRALDCPYKDPNERWHAQYPCSDYEARE